MTASTTTEMEQDRNLEKEIQKHMGCMAGFMQIFDRHHILTGKRIYTASKATKEMKVDSTTAEPENSVGSPVRSTVSEKAAQPSPTAGKKSTAATEAGPAESPRTPPAFEFKEGTRSLWKFRESPRLSLDSRATVDAKGILYRPQLHVKAKADAAKTENSGDGSAAEDGEKQRRSTSVIARLMGLDPLTGDSNPSPDPMAKSELRRSASESRVCRDLFQSRMVEGNGFQPRQTPQVQQQCNLGTNAIAMRNSINLIEDGRKRDPNCRMGYYSSRAAKVDQPKAAAAQRGGSFSFGAATSPMKLFRQRRRFDSGDVFPGPRQTGGVIQRRLKTTTTDEPSTRDVETTLKQILVGLQLKGLLHHSKSLNSDEHIIVIRPSRSISSPIRNPPRFGNDFPPSSFGSRSPVARRNLNHPVEIFPPANFRRNRTEIDPIRGARNQPRCGNSMASPTRSDNSAKSTASLTARRKALHVETRRKANGTTDPRRTSPINSPRSSCRATGGANPTACRSPRKKKPTAQTHPAEKISGRVQTEDESSSSVSDGSLSTSSHTDSEMRSKAGRGLLERCDNLLHSIAEITTTAELQPSPVSVLDSSFYKEDESAPSPVMKRGIDFLDLAGAELEEEFGSPERSEDSIGDCDFAYVSEILRALNFLPQDSDIFHLLEKQQLIKGKSASRVSKLQRRLIFDTISEIVDRRRRLPPWKAMSSDSANGKPRLQEIWAEFERIREIHASSEDVSEAICGVLRKDFSVGGWGDWPSETSGLVLDIERQVFKDLISETIQYLPSLGGRIEACCVVPRRKLVF